MFDNWDWISFLFGVVLTAVFGGSAMFLVGFFNLDNN